MITEELGQRLDEFLGTEVEYEYKDRLVEGKPHTAVLFEGKWYLAPIHFKFGGCPYFNMDRGQVREVTEEELAGLPVWTTEKLPDVE